MGKVITIQGADFSANSLGAVNTSSNIPVKKTQTGVQYMDYQGLSAIRQLYSGSSSVNTVKMMVADVSDYVGSTISITSANAIVNGAYYACFASSLGGLNFSEIPSLSPVSANNGVNTEITKIGDSFNISDNDKTEKTITKVVPQGARYLLFTLKFGGDLNESHAGVEVAST